MKKILTLLISLFAVATQAMATVVWEGTLTFTGWSPSENVQIPASAFADATTDHQLVLSCQKINPSAWGAILPEAGNWGGKYEGYTLYYELLDALPIDIYIPLEASLLAQAKEKGMMFSGDNLTLTKVRLVEKSAIDSVNNISAPRTTSREYQLCPFISIEQGKKILLRPR